MIHKKCKILKKIQKQVKKISSAPFTWIINLEKVPQKKKNNNNKKQASICFSLTSRHPPKTAASSWQHGVKITQAYFPQAENKMEQDQFGQTRSKWLLLIHTHSRTHTHTGCRSWWCNARAVFPSGYRHPLSSSPSSLLRLSASQIPLYSCTETRNQQLSV